MVFVYIFQHRSSCLNFPHPQNSHSSSTSSYKMTKLFALFLHTEHACSPRCLRGKRSFVIRNCRRISSTLYCCPSNSEHSLQAGDHELNRVATLSLQMSQNTSRLKSISFSSMSREDTESAVFL